MITRRQFLKRVGVMGAAALTGPGLFDRLLLQQAFAETFGDRFLVVLYLDGGNDGLNTVTPLDNGNGFLRTAYDAARPTNGTLHLSPEDLEASLIGLDPNTGARLALHPALSGLKDLYDLGKVAVLQGCGYPEYTTSHEYSRGIWQTADPLRRGINTGWVGRYLAATFAGDDTPGVSLSEHVAGELRQDTTGVLAMSRLRDFGFPYDPAFGMQDKRSAFASLCAANSACLQPSLSSLGRTAMSTLLSSETYPSLDTYYNQDRGDLWNPQYDAVQGTLADDLREIAKVMYGVSRGVPNVGARFFQARALGYDLHADQGGAEATGQHSILHKAFGDSLKVFYEDLADMGVADKTCILVWSEFGRRVPQNHNGTDHGSQGPVFVVGGSVLGGVYGHHPNISASALDANGNTEYRQGPGEFRSTDLRDVYGTILKHWLGMPVMEIATVLPVDPGDPEHYWTIPNFDLGML